MGATASTFQKYNEIASCRKRGETVIPIENVHEQLRMFQHQKDGDILILLKADAISFLKDRISSQYHEIFISRRGTEYLDHVSLALKFQASKMLQESSTSQNSKEALKRNSKELSLYDQHILENPENFFDFSSSTAPTDIPGTINSKSSLDRPKSGSTKYERSLEASPGSDLSVVVGESYNIDHDSARLGIAGNSEISGAAISFSGLSVDKESESIRNNRMQSFGSTAYSVDHTHSVDIDSDNHGQSSLSGSSKLESISGQQLHTSSAAANFRKHEQELLARARTEGLNRVPELPVVPVVGVSPRITPRRAEAKDSNSLPPNTHSNIPLSARNRNTTPIPTTNTSTTGKAGMLGSSPAESKDSKDIPETTAATGPKRTFAPVAYLPFNAKLRKRILDEEISQQGVQAKSSDPGFKDEVSAAYLNSVMIPRYPVEKTPDLGAKAGGGEDGAFFHLTPRGPALNTTADSKPPSLRSAFIGVDSTMSQLTSTLAGIGESASTYTSYCGNSSYICPICQQELRANTSINNSDMVGRYESHVNTCTMRREMKAALENIDQNLEPKLDELTEYNSKQLALVYSSAIGRAAEEFDECAAAHKIVKKMVKSVIRLTYDTSMKKFQRIQDQLVQVQEHVAASIADAQRAHQQGHLEAQRRLNCFTNLSRILTQTIEKLGHKRQNVLYYRQYLIGIQDFTLIRKLGKGAFASVYLARVSDTSKLYAIKVISKSSIRSGDLYDQIMKERTALSMASRYPDYFVNLQCCFQNKDSLFFALEYMQGGDCLSLLSTVKRLPEHAAQHFIAQVSIALKHLHEHGVIHRDIKPDNVMITARGHAKLGDFGSVFRIHSDYQRNKIAPISHAAAAQKGTGGSENSDQPSGSKDSSSRGGGAGTMNQLTSEITAAAELAFKRMTSGKSSSKSNSDSNSQWLEEESVNSRDSANRDSNCGSENFSNSTSSSLFFNKATKGPMLLNTFDIVGNYFYASPEMAAGACVYNQSVDWWAVGVLLFHMLCGTTPFEGLTKAATLENIERMQCDWEVLPTVSPACRNFLERILTHTFDTRLGSGSAEEILHHRFFADIDFNTLYDGYGPLYPRPPPVDDTSSDFYCFSLLSDEEALDLPRYSPCKIDPREGREEGGAKGVAEDSIHSVLDSPRAAALRAEEEDYFLDFDYHPF